MSRSYSARTVPVLHSLLCDLGEKATAKGAMPGDAQIIRLAQEELHAVLGVVRVAERQGPLVSAEWDMKLGRAFRRLEHAGGGKP